MTQSLARQQRRHAGISSPPMPAGIDPDVARLQQLGALSLEVLERFVRTQRLSGVSWAGVGRLLGCTRQSAWRRWRHVDEYAVEVVRVRDVLGVRQALIVCAHTGAASGRLEDAFVAAYGSVPAERMRGCVPAIDVERQDVIDGVLA